MGFWGCWLLAVMMIAGSAEASRGRRQLDWWRSPQRAAPRPGSPRWGAGEHHWGASPVLGYGASRGQSQWGSSSGRPGGMPRQLPQSGGSAVTVQCGEDVMVVSVKMDFYGNGRLVKPSDLSLGPQNCKPGSPSADSHVFQVNLQDCGNVLQMTPDWMIYSTNLTYSPTSPRNVPITRTNSAVIPIYCYYTRYGNVSSKAIKPTWIPFSTTMSTEERLAFSLRLMTRDWSGPRDSMVYELGDTIYIEASVDIQNHINMILFVDSCVATISSDPNSSPRYELITANGCLVDGTQEDSSSAFTSPRIDPSKLQFTIDAFRFVNVEVSVIYITCQLRATAATQVPDSTNKACSYSKATQSWSAVEGSSNICQCCDSRTCSIPSSSVRAWGSFGRPRGHWKRDVEHHFEELGQASLGPLLVIEAQGEPVARTEISQASRTSPESRPVQLWMLVTVACVGLVLLAVAVALVGKCILNRPACS